MVALSDETAARFFNWAHSLTNTQTSGGCTIGPNPADPSIVFLMDPADVKNPPTATVTQNCTIARGQKILIPLWIGWCDNSDGSQNSPGQLTKRAREEYNLGHIRSEVTLDSDSIAKLDVKVSKGGGVEGPVQHPVIQHSHSSEFDLTTPSTSIKVAWGAKPSAAPWKSGCDGFWVIHDGWKEKGQHKISYNTKVANPDPNSPTSPGTPFSSANITYNLTVQ
jgi:hypothetical protein